MRRVSIAAFLLGMPVASPAALAEEALSFEGRIALPGVAGRIDHMAVDVARKRLLVAALGNGTLEIVDLADGQRVKQVVALREPQGVAYAQKADRVAVANAGDGSVRFFRGEDLAAAGSLALGSDADNVRIDPRTGNVIVGYGSGGLAIIDPQKKLKIGDITLAAHPESFQLDPVSGRISPTFPMPAKSPLSTLQRQNRWRAGRYRVCGQISRWQSTVPAQRSPWSSGTRQSSSCFPTRPAHRRNSWTLAVTPTTSFSTRNADGSMSAAAPGRSTSFRSRRQATVF